MAEITGKIVDIDNEPLIGANVTLITGLKANKIGTTSDFDGNFILNSNSFTDSDVFQISYIGFVKQNFTASELKNRKIILKEAVGELDEIVVIGTKPKPIISQETNKKNFKTHLEKNKYIYAGLGGFLGIILIFISVKKLN
jgi:hypothetical protein